MTKPAPSSLLQYSWRTSPENEWQHLVTPGIRRALCGADGMHWRDITSTAPQCRVCKRRLQQRSAGR